MAGENSDYLALEERIEGIEKSVEKLGDQLDPEKLGEAIAKALPGETDPETGTDEKGDKPELAEVVKTAVDEATKDFGEKLAKLDGKVEALGAGGSAQPNGRVLKAAGDAEHAGIL